MSEINTEMLLVKVAELNQITLLCLSEAFQTKDTTTLKKIANDIYCIRYNLMQISNLVTATKRYLDLNDKFNRQEKLE